MALIDLDRGDATLWLAQMASMRARCAATAVVVVGTAAGLEGPAGEAGADAFLTKLESPRALCDAIQAALRARATRR